MTNDIAQQWNKIGEAFGWDTKYRLDQMYPSPGDEAPDDKTEQLIHRAKYYKHVARRLDRLTGFTFEFPERRSVIIWSVRVFLEKPERVVGKNCEVVLDSRVMATVEFSSEHSFDDALLAALTAFIYDPLFHEFKEKGMLRI